MAEEELLTVREVARRVGRSEETVRRWIWSGKLPARKLGNQHFVLPADVDAVTALRAGEPRVVYGARRGKNAKVTIEFQPEPEELPYTLPKMTKEQALKNLEKAFALGQELRAIYGPYDVVAALRRHRDEGH